MEDAVDAWKREGLAGVRSCALLARSAPAGLGHLHVHRAALLPAPAAIARCGATPLLRLLCSLAAWPPRGLRPRSPTALPLKA
eukprot:scaffold23543_cov118-Isochrysis_galbana.AAC.1